VKKKNSLPPKVKHREAMRSEQKADKPKFVVVTVNPFSIFRKSCWCHSEGNSRKLLR